MGISLYTLILNNQLKGNTIMVDNNTIKANARAQLGGNIFAENWLMILVAYLIYSAISGIASTVTAGLATIFIVGPLEFGLARICIKRACGEPKVDFMDMFKGFTDNFMGSMLLGLLQGLLIALWSLLFIVPGVLKSYSWALSFYIQQDDPSKDWKTCLDESAAMMYGHRWQLFCIDFTMFLWSLLGVLACGIGVLFVLPYQYMSHANFYLALKASREPAPTYEANFTQNDSDNTTQL